MEALKEKLKKALLWKPDTRLLAVLAGIVLLVLLAPLIRITKYCTPWYDDYSYGDFVKFFLEQEYSLGSALRGAAHCVKTQWWAWQGTFSSVFFMALVPIVWGEEWYFMGPLFLILILVASVLVLGRTLLRDVLGCDRSSAFVLQAVTAVLVLELVHLSREGLFWYNAGIHYVGMHSFFLLFIAVMTELLSDRKKAATGMLTVLSLIGAVLVSGANFVTTLQGLLTVIFLIGLGAVLKRKRVLLLLPASLVYAIGFYMNVTAPGNDKRADNYVGWGLDPVHAVLQSFVEAFRHLWEFTGWVTILLLILAVPVIWRMAGKISFRFPLPGAVLLLSFCLYATGFTPSLYSLGHAGLGRTLNAVKITFQILLVLNEIYWLGWFRKALERRGKKVWQGQCCWWFYVAAAGMALAVVFSVPTPIREGIYSSWGAYYFVHSGEAHNFYQEYQERVETIKNSGPDVTVKPYAWNPWLIRVGDLSEDPEKEENRYMAVWYDKDSIVCAP